MCFAIGLAAAIATAQSPATAVDAHVAAARAAAGQEYTGLFRRLCEDPNVGVTAPRRPAASSAGSQRRPGPPDRSQWHAEPVKVFDNLYFVGTKEHTAWAVTTSGGIIVIDPLYAYAVEDEVVEGLKTLGFDPATIKYVLVSHGHGDHAGGAAYLQDRFDAHIVTADWDLLDRTTSGPRKPKRDIVATDGQKLTLGDTTLTLHLTPGHTPGTVSTLIPVKDRGRPHVAALWGGTAFNFAQTPENFKMYIASAERFSKIAVAARADIILSNHVAFDGSDTKLPALATRKLDGPHPYVVGTDSVKRYLQVAGECAKAGLGRLVGGPR